MWSDENRQMTRGSVRGQLEVHVVNIAEEIEVTKQDGRACNLHVTLQTSSHAKWKNEKI